MEIEVVSELIEQYGTEVMIFCRRLTGCVPDAQDLYQQTFLKLMEMRVRIEREKNPRRLYLQLPTASGRTSAVS